MPSFKQAVSMSATPNTLADLSDYTKKSISWGDGSGEYLDVYYLPDEMSQTIYVGSAFNQSTSERIKEVILQTNNTESAQSTGTLTVTQEAGEMTFADPVITKISSEIIPASGGTVVPVVEYQQTWGWNGETTGGGVITSGADLSYSGTYNVVDESTGAVTAVSKGTTESDQTIVDRVTVTVTLNGKSSTSDEVIVYQAENKIENTEYTEPIVSCVYIQVAKTRAATNVVNINVIASGGTYEPSVTISQTRTETYTTGDTRVTTLTTADSIVFSGINKVVDETTGVVEISSLGTLLKAETIVEEVTVTATANGKEGVCDNLFRFTQAENKIEFTDYSTPQVSIAYEDSPVSAAGGTVYPTISIVQTKIDIYTSGDSETMLLYSGDVEYKDTLGLIDDNGAVTFEEMEPGALELTDVVTVTVTANEKTGTASTNVVQEANDLVNTEYSDVTVNLSYDETIISAAGGEVTPIMTYEQTVTYTFKSGATVNGTLTLGGDVTYSGEVVDPVSGTVSAESLETTEKEETVIDTVTVSVTMNGKTGTSAAVEIKQEANVKTLKSTEYSDIEASLTYNPTVISAAGGIASPSLTYNQVQTDNYTYTSGAESSTSTNLNSGAEVTYSGTEGVVNASSGTVTASSKGSIVSEQTLVDTVKATITMNGKAKFTDEVTIYQAKNDVTVSYAVPDVNLSFDSTMIPASGGSVQASVTYTQVVTESYDSGTVVNSTIESSGGEISYSGTNGVVTSDGIVSADSRGTVYSEVQLTIDIVTATVTMNGQTGTSNSVMIYQEENVIVDTQYTVPEVSFSYDDIPAAGGTVTPQISYSQTKTDIYTSGATTSEDITSGATFTYSGSGVSSDGSVTASSLGTTEKARTVVATSVVTVTVNGKSTTSTASVYQEANTATTSDHLSEVNIYSDDDSPLAYTSNSALIEVEAYITRTYTYTSGSTTSTKVALSSSDISAVYSITDISLEAADPQIVNNDDATATLSWTPYPGNGDGDTYNLCVVKVDVTYDGVSLSDSMTLKVKESLFQVSPETISFNHNGGEEEIEVDAQEDWTVSEEE